MNPLDKTFVHFAIDQVDTVLHDPEGSYDAERFDRYATFTEARDAALCCLEAMLDEQDYDGEDHREELERMIALLEAAPSFETLERQAGYQWFLDRITTPRTAAA